MSPRFSGDWNVGEMSSPVSNDHARMRWSCPAANKYDKHGEVAIPCLYVSTMSNSVQMPGTKLGVYALMCPWKVTNGSVLRANRKSNSSSCVCDEINEPSLPKCGTTYVTLHSANKHLCLVENTEVGDGSITSSEPALK